MVHGDDDGIILPPRLAPQHVVILPIFRNDEEQASVMEYCKRVQKELAAATYDGQPVRVMIDARDLRGGEKTWQHIKKGVPLRLEIGPRDVAGDAVFVGRRDTSTKQPTPRAELVATIGARLAEIQQNLFARALAFREQNTRKIDDREEFIRYFTPQNEEKPEIHGGFALSHYAEETGSRGLLAQAKGNDPLPSAGRPIRERRYTGPMHLHRRLSPRAAAVFAKAY